ncbi:MAG: HK97 gp10 family phage protein [Acidobacteria bacterium]|nr:HK97 gp10 family phage protein [Acidobacteriota bacterium]
MTVEEFERALGDFGETMSNLSPILTEIGGRIVDSVKEGAPIDTGALRQSIKAVIEDDTLALEMLYYGIFQNYGVDGMNQAVATDVPQFGVPQPTAGRRFGFSGNYEMIGGDLPFGVRKSIYKLGLKPQSFFDVDAITQVVADGVTQALTREF